MKLSLEEFGTVVRNTVLVSLDLLIVRQGEILVGRRRNSPAKGYLFVPGGRIYKGETPKTALARISREEVGVELKSDDVIFHGIYHHRFDENFFEDHEIGPTEYVAIACMFRLGSYDAFWPDSQHDLLQFVSIDELQAHPEVHEFTKNYFAKDPDNIFLSGGNRSWLEEQE